MSPREGIRVAARAEILGAALTALLGAADPPHVLTGAAAFDDWRADAPGTRRKITSADLPRPLATGSSPEGARIVWPPAGAHLATLPGFSVRRRSLPTVWGTRAKSRSRPMGDVFVAESRTDRIRVLRADGAGKAEKCGIFASGLDSPFGITFYPPGAPTHNTSMSRTLPRRSAFRTRTELCAEDRGCARDRRAEPCRKRRRPWTRDIVFSPDGKRMFVSVGAESNDAEGLSHRPPAGWVASHPLGAAWGQRAGVRSRWSHGRIFATGIRNCMAMAIAPETGDLWCVTNESDGLGDNLPPDYATRAREGGFYGWPWYSATMKTAAQGRAPDLVDKIIVPDHSAPLGMTFCDGAMFPAGYRGSAFVALRGSWNRHQRTGYKIVRVLLKDGAPNRRLRGFRYRLRHGRRQRPGPSGWRCGGQGRRVALQRRRQRHDLAGRFSGQHADFGDVLPARSLVPVRIHVSYVCYPGNCVSGEDKPLWCKILTDVPAGITHPNWRR